LFIVSTLPEGPDLASFEIITENAAPLTEPSLNSTEKSINIFVGKNLHSGAGEIPFLDISSVNDNDLAPRKGGEQGSRSNNKG
jgi:hypothetical protein